MNKEIGSVVLAPDERCWRPFLFNGATGLVYWLALTLAFVITAFALMTTRFAPGAALPESRLTVMVVPDPARPDGAPLILRTSELARFRAEHPGARLAPAPRATTTLEADGPRNRRSYRVVYSARDLGGGRTEMMVRGATPFIDSPGAFASVALGYTVTGDHVEPTAMVSFDPFMTWLTGVLLGLVASLSIGRGLEKWLLDRPLAQGRWRMLPPLNRDWLVTRGIPLRFDQAPASLDALAAALRRAGATVRYEQEQGALTAEFGKLAALAANLRKAKKQPPILDVLINGGLTPLASLLVVLIAPVAGLIAVGMLLFWLLDPFAAFADSAAWIAVLAAVAAASAYLGWHWLQRPGLTEEGNRLATILIETLAAQGARNVPPPKWPRLAPPLPKWRRLLAPIVVGAMLLAFAAMLAGLLA